MPNLHAASLDVLGFRGIARRLQLQFGRRLTIIYGGNASGKSSIAQAIEFAISGQVLDHDDTPIPARFLSNSTYNQPGHVKLALTDGVTPISVTGSAGETRNQIEQRFRSVASVDWPDRQHIPVTTTHFMTQGALARVLGSASVTRNDLSSLCTGAYLRFLLNRAERLADYFRQAASGRNMQSDLKDARAAYEAARVLRESLAGTTAAAAAPTRDPQEELRAIAADFDLVDENDVNALIAFLDARIDSAEHSLAAIQRLLGRMGDLGQYEVELNQLRTQLNDRVTAENSLLGQRDELNAALEDQRKRESLTNQLRSDALDVIGAYERYQQSASAIESLSARLAEVRTSLKLMDDQLRVLSQRLDAAAADQKQKSNSVIELDAQRRVSIARLSAIDAAIEALKQMPEEELTRSSAELRESEVTVARARLEEAAALAQLQGAQEIEIAAEQRLNELSEATNRFVGSVTELRTFVHDASCPLCRHVHPSRDALEAAIAKTLQLHSATSRPVQEQFELAAADRHQKAVAHARAVDQLRIAEGAATRAREMHGRLDALRLATLARAEQALSEQALQLETSTESLRVARDALVATITAAETALAAARESEHATSVTRNDLEREVARRIAEREQLQRLIADLQLQIDDVQLHKVDPVSAERIAQARQDVAAADATLGELRRSIGQVTAQLTELARQVAESAAHRAGAARRLEVIEGLLQSLDGDLRQVGATRDVSVLLNLEASARRTRDKAVDGKARAVAVQQQLTDIDRNRRYSAADHQYQAALLKLDALQERQQQLNNRAEQFRAIQRDLEAVQSTTAEAVLANVRLPVRTMFRAMTAGCQWDIAFSSTVDGRIEARLLDALGEEFPANAVLNSAYLNISAIALRIALASQQNWTSFRTVVLDDPVLEMDSLTQSALIDGFEALLSSASLPWVQLQFIVTTWSEDFAVLAAHKLAHLNSADHDDFVVYRLTADADGSIAPERHTPRWKAQAHAA